jgi:hypothetical protein
LAPEATKEIALEPIKEAHVVVSYPLQRSSQKINMIEAPCKRNSLQNNMIATPYKGANMCNNAIEAPM